MNSVIRNRLQRAEKRHKNTGYVCPDCGASGSPHHVVDFSVSWADWTDTPPFSEAPQPEWCATCHTQTTFIVDWADHQPPIGEEGNQL
jgi:hypothetical protein